MYSPDDLKDMTQEQAQEAFDALAQGFYRTARWKTEFARGSGVTSTAVNRWFSDGTPPAWAFMLLQSWIERDAALHQLRKVRDAIAFTDALD